MKISIGLFLLFCLQFQFAFSQINDLTRNNIKGNVIIINEHTYSAKKVKKKIEEDKLLNSFINLYDSKGFKTEDIKLNSEGKLDKRYAYFYNENNSRKATHIYTIGSYLEYKIVYLYDEAGNLIQDVSYDNNNNKLKTFKYSYDGAGYLIEDISFDKDENLQKKFNYTNNNLGQKIKTQIYNSKGELERTITFEYDKNSNLIEEKNFSNDGNLLFTNSFIYEYDKTGNWIKKFHLRNGEADKITIRNITYG